MRNFILACCLLMTGAANAASVTLDFEELSIIDTPIPLPVVTQGFSLSSELSTYAIREVINAPTKVLYYSPNQPLLIENALGSPFDLDQLDYGRINSLAAGTVTITGFYAAGGSISVNLATTANASTGQLDRFIFGNDWSGLSSVEIGVGTAQAFTSGIDNIVVNVVPIPPALLLFASGLGLLGWLKRRAAD